MRRAFISSLIILFIINTGAVFSQKSVTKMDVKEEKLSLGLGLGQIYGGIGINLMYFPQRNIGLFGGMGYSFAGTGYNVGTKIRYLPKNYPSTSVFLLGMYGYNAAIAVAGESDFNKLYYGPSVGLGFDAGRGPRKKGYWSFAIIKPFRETAVDEYIDHLEKDHDVEFKRSLLPVTISVGFHFGG